DSVWVVAGQGGAMWRTTNRGASWSSVATGTSQDLNAVRFADEQHGWAAGDGGTLLHSADGGASWTPVPLATSTALLSVDQRGATVWAVGANGAAWRSTNSGASFGPVRLRLDARADVRCVVLTTPDSVWLAGGGGFIRWSADGGATWTYGQHPMHAPITCLAVLGSGAWAGNASNRVVLSTLHAGA